MSDGATLSSEELKLIREGCSSQLVGEPASMPAFKGDGGLQANALLFRLCSHAQLPQEAQMDDCGITFRRQRGEDELGGLQLDRGAPSIFQDGQVSRPWRLEWDEPLTLRDGKGGESGLLVYELAPTSLVLGSPMAEPPEKFSLWLPLPGFDSLPIK